MDDTTNNNMRNLLAKIGSIAQGATTDMKSGLDQYIDQLIADKKFPDLTEEVKTELKKDIGERLDNFIAARVITELSDEDVLKFESMLKDKKPEEEIQQFISAHIQDFTNFLTNVLLEFRGVYLGELNAPINTNSVPEEAKILPELKRKEVVNKNIN